MVVHFKNNVEYILFTFVKLIMKFVKITTLLFFVLLFFYFPFVSYSQESSGGKYNPKPIFSKAINYEMGVFLGGSYYTGDLNPSGHFNRFTRPAIGVLYRANFNPRFSAKAIISYGSIEGDDSYSKSEFQRNRNLSFRSKLTEFALEGEMNFLPYSTGKFNLSLSSPYVFLGISVFHFDPKALYMNTWYELQPLGTEGQNSSFTNLKSYSLVQFAIPFGIGTKINIAKRIGLNLEWGLRKTFTDYLDDVSGSYADPRLLAAEKGLLSSTLADRSFIQGGGTNAERQRGNSLAKDWYSFVGVVLTIKFTEKAEECSTPH